MPVSRLTQSVKMALMEFGFETFPKMRCQSFVSRCVAGGTIDGSHATSILASSTSRMGMSSRTG